MVQFSQAVYQILDLPPNPNLKPLSTLLDPTSPFCIHLQPWLGIWRDPAFPFQSVMIMRSLIRKKES